MGARSNTIPSDAKLRIEEGSIWGRYPMIFGAIGVALLLVAFVFGQSGPDNSHGHGDDHGATAAAASVHHDDGHGEKAKGDHHGAAGDHSAKKDDHHGTAGDHAQDDHHGADASDKKAAGHDDAHHDEHGAGGAHADDGHGGGHHGGGQRFWYSYLTAYMWALSIALGGLFFVVIQFLVRAGWSVVVRRVAENVMGTLPLFAVLFIPVFIGLPDTHQHWWNVKEGIDPLLDGKRGYLNQSFFYIRTVGYLVIWTVLSMYFLRNSVAQDTSGDHSLTRKLQAWSPIGVILFGLTVTFAAIDWVKTMDPHWYSTMWGVYYFAGCLVGIFSTMALLIIWLQRDGYVQKVINEEHYHDIGKLLFGFNVFWTYIAFSQYFLIWYANIPEEQLWFEHRSEGGWREFGMFLAIGHFFIPFFFLLPRAIKRNRVTLFIGAAWLLFMQYVDVYFMIMPMFSHQLNPSIVDGLAAVGMLSLLLAGVAYWMNRSHLIPIKDPRLPESLAFENI